MAPSRSNLVVIRRSYDGGPFNDRLRRSHQGYRLHCVVASYSVYRAVGSILRPRHSNLQKTSKHRILDGDLRFNEMNTTKPEATILKAGGFIVILCSLLRVSQLITQISLTFANVSIVDMTDKEIEIVEELLAVTFASFEQMDQGVEFT